MKVKKVTFGDFVLIEGVMAIGAAEVAHLAGVFLKWNFSRCAMLFGILSILMLLAGGLLLFVQREKWLITGKKQVLSPVAKGLYGAFALVVFTQLLFILFGDVVYRQGDMTVETVGSFLEEDGIYQVNPLTGQAYTAGIPFRLQILCLPTLYGSICSITGLEPVFVVQKLIPVVTLLGSYLAFALLGRSLFGEDRSKRSCFLLVVSVLVWGSAYMYGMDGFGLLCSGFRGVTLRNCMLIPWVFSLCIRKNWLGVVLCVLAEACILWTLYGMGACLLIGAGMFAVIWFCGKFLGLVGESTGKEEA